MRNPRKAFLKYYFLNTVYSISLQNSLQSSLGKKNTKSLLVFGFPFITALSHPNIAYETAG